MTSLPRRLDHAVVAVHDLDAAGAFYERLGFQVGARNHHPWGTENRLIQFSKSFIELITVGTDVTAIPKHEPKRFSFGAFVRDYLREREGFAMLALDSADAKFDAAFFAHEGLGSFEPFHFERKGRRPDGSDTHVAFTLAFAVDVNAPSAGFFVCEQHFPENFWNPDFQRHENGAIAIAAVGMSAGVPRMHRDFLAAFSRSSANCDEDGSLLIELCGSELRVEAGTASATNLRLDSLVVQVPHLSAHAARLLKANIPFIVTDKGLSLSPEAAFGVAILFQANERQAA